MALAFAVELGPPPPPGLGAPRRLQDIGAIGHGLPRRGPTGRRVENRGWLDAATAQASPAPWPGCPDAIAVVGGSARMVDSWHVDA
eukprot:7207705-Pyramimonas_sp.AAC.1